MGEFVLYGKIEKSEGVSVGYGLCYEVVGGEVENVVWCGVEKRYDDHGVECFFPFVGKEFDFGHFEQGENV